MLNKYPVEFYVADVGRPHRRVNVDKCYDFWKSEVNPHLAGNPENGFELERFPGSYLYVASEWSGEF